MPPIDINFPTLSNFGNLPNLHGNVIGHEFSESLTVTTLDLKFPICQHSSISKDEFLRKRKVVTHTESRPLDKNEKKANKQTNKQNNKGNKRI